MATEQTVLPMFSHPRPSAEADRARESQSPDALDHLGNPTKRHKANTKTACDRCRKRKIKCEEERPCSKCLAANDSCVTTALDRIRYNSAHLDVRPSDEEVALRKSQKAAKRPKLPKVPSNGSNTTLPQKRKTSVSPALPPRVAPSHSASSASGVATPAHHTDGTNPWSHGVYMDDSGSVVHASSSSGLPLVERLGGFQPEQNSAPDHSSTSATGDFCPGSQQTHQRDTPPVDLSSCAIVDPYRGDIWPAVTECCPMDLLHALIRNHLEGAEQLAPFLHQPEFTRQYIACCEGQQPCSPAFGALLMAIAALSSRTLPQDIRVLADANNSRSAGLRYFQRSRILLRLPQDRLSLHYISALIYLSAFVEGLGDTNLHVMIQAEAIGLALQTGLHREQSSFDPVQTESRKRTFWALYTLDKAMACAQGRTPILKVADCNVSLPVACDDSCITPEGIQPQPSGKPNIAHAAFNALIQLHVIIEHILVFINAPNQVDNCDPQTSLLYSFRRSIAAPEIYDRSEMLSQAEVYLEQWMLGVPEHLRLSNTLGRIDPDEHPHQYISAIRLVISYNLIQGLIARERIVMELNEACESGRQLAYGDVAHKASDAASTIAQLFGLLDARGLIARYFPFQHVSYLSFAAHTLLSIMAVYQAVSADHIQVVEKVLSLLEKSSHKFASAVKASQLLHQIAKGLKIHLKVAPNTDYGDRLRVRVVPQSRPTYEMQPRDSVSGKMEDRDWIALASQGHTNRLTPAAGPASMSHQGPGGAIFSQSSVRGSGNEGPVPPSPGEELPPRPASLSGVFSSSAAASFNTNSSFKPFNHWTPTAGTIGLPPAGIEGRPGCGGVGGEMSDLLASFGLTYADPLEDNLSTAHAVGGLRDNLFGVMTNTYMPHQ